jgi:hypothetical protein
MHRHRFNLMTAAVGAILALLPAAGSAQGPDTTALAVPPVEQLAKLSPYFGSYKHDANDGNEWMGAGPFRGTLDVGPAVKGWYVEWVINTHYGPIDRQLRMLVTWDDQLGRYRVWGFDTNPQTPPGTVEGEGSIRGDEFVMEWKESRGPRGERGTFRNRVRMNGPNALVIVSEVELESGETMQLGVWRNNRIIAVGERP